jgi:hypothetical protein
MNLTAPKLRFAHPAHSDLMEFRVCANMDT